MGVRSGKVPLKELSDMSLQSRHKPAIHLIIIYFLLMKLESHFIFSFHLNYEILAQPTCLANIVFLVIFFFKTSYSFMCDASLYTLVYQICEWILLHQKEKTLGNAIHQDMFW
jgi:hypothetical protein